MPHRYFTTEIADGTATLRGADAQHLARVMRGKLGDTVILCDGNAVEYTAVITGFGPETVEFSVEPGYPSAAEPSVEVTLFAGYPKQDKLEQVIRHGVELGCAHFVPFFSRYCVAAPKKEEQKNERYNRIALEAAKQSGRGKIPEIGGQVLKFKDAVAEAKRLDGAIIPYEREEKMGLREFVKDFEGESIGVFIGPEGGFAEEEIALAKENGITPITLGKRILRTETAGMTTTAILLYELD